MWLSDGDGELGWGKILISWENNSVETIKKRKSDLGLLLARYRDAQHQPT